VKLSACTRERQTPSVLDVSHPGETTFPRTSPIRAFLFLRMIFGSVFSRRYVYATTKEKKLWEPTFFGLGV